MRTDTHTDRHTPLTTRPDGLRRAGNDNVAWLKLTLYHVICQSLNMNKKVYL